MYTTSKFISTIALTAAMGLAGSQAIASDYRSKNSDCKGLPSHSELTYA